MHGQNERDLLQKTHYYLSEPSRVLATISGKRLQVLSPGKVNLNDGPDLKNIALLLNGYVVVGDAEFHINESDWQLHKHDENSDYDDVILHIVLKRDARLSNQFETLHLDESLIKSIVADESENQIDIEGDIEELQNYALIRLLRMTAASKKLLKNTGLHDGFRKCIENFLKRYSARSRRPSYSTEKLGNIVQEISASNMLGFLESLESKQNISIPDVMQNLIRNRIGTEGAHLRRELVLNCLLPVALSIADDNSRISLFSWFWSTTALHSYGILKKRFPNLPQNFLWQQQGMLEYIKENGRKPDYISEARNTYGFAEILSFYKLGRLPLDILEI